jgi:hypothetical protein
VAAITKGPRPLRWSVPVDDDWHLVGGGQVLHVASRQRGVVEVWTLEAPDPVEPRLVRVYGTGHYVHPRDSIHHGTALDGPLVWHVFGSA